MLCQIITNQLGLSSAKLKKSIADQNYDQGCFCWRAIEIIPIITKKYEHWDVLLLSWIWDNIVFGQEFDNWANLYAKGVT